MAANQGDTSKMPKEEHHVTWKIADFSIIRSSPEALKTPSFRFELGSTIGLPTQWRCYMICEKVEEKFWVGVNIGLEKTTGVSASKVLAQVYIKLANQTNFNEEQGAMTDMLQYNGRRYFLFSQDGDDQATPLSLDAEGNLCLDLKVILYNADAMTDDDPLSCLVTKFKAKFLSTLLHDLQMMFQNPEPPCTAVPLTVTLVSSDGKEFTMNRGILAARNPIFKAMLQNFTGADGKQGDLLNIEDISGQALKALLLYLGAGCLADNWMEPEVLQGLADGAHKYEVKELHDFLEKAKPLVAIYKSKKADEENGEQQAGAAGVNVNAANKSKSKFSFRQMFQKIWKRNSGGDGASNK